MKEKEIEGGREGKGEVLSKREMVIILWLVVESTSIAQANLRIWVLLNLHLTILEGILKIDSRLSNVCVIGMFIELHVFFPRLTRIHRINFVPILECELLLSNVFG